MPIYTYKAMTKDGLIVRNKVEAQTKQSLAKLLKNNGFIPISVEKNPYAQKGQKTKKKKNTSAMDEFMKNLNTTRIERANEPTTKEKIKLYFDKSKKITPRDIVVFTQNFYLLKTHELFLLDFQEKFLQFYQHDTFH